MNEIETMNVVVRIKPKTAENSNQEYSSMIISENKYLIFNNKQFCFDYILDENSTQYDIFKCGGKKMCDEALKGYNCTIFAYGQTGSGKTYTLLGKNITNQPKNKKNKSTVKYININQDIEMNENNNNNFYSYDSNDENIGLLPRVLDYLFKQKKVLKENNIDFKISYTEIYQNNLKDLLVNLKKKKPKILYIPKKK